jgi:hypothetical protein
MPPPFAPPAPQFPAPAWRLVLNRGAKRFLVIIMVVGLAAAVVQQVVVRPFGRNDLNNVNTLNNAVSTLNQQFDSYTSSTESCSADSDATTRVACVEGTAATISTQLRDFANRIDGLNVFGFSSQVSTAVNDARTCARIFDRLANAGPTVADYEQVDASVGLQQHLNALSNAVNQI